MRFGKQNEQIRNKVLNVSKEFAQLIDKACLSKAKNLQNV